MGITWGSEESPERAGLSAGLRDEMPGITRRMGEIAAEMTAELHRRLCLPSALHLGWTTGQDSER